MKIIHVVGARPNFVKAAPVINCLAKRDKQVVIHTGQHYSPQMSDTFFNSLNMPEPDYNLGVGSGTHGAQTARVLETIEKIFISEEPDMVFVYGDVNSTLAAAIAASKLNIKVAHVESGLRSGDMTMPEEINRILVDSISDMLFVTESNGLANLFISNIPTQKIHFVGNTMIDSLVRNVEKTKSKHIEMNYSDKKYVLFTCHRPSNVDTEIALKKVLEIFKSIEYPIIFPAHYRTINNIKKFNLWDEFKSVKNLDIIEPVGYLEFLHMVKKSYIVITDSGGLQEETTFLRKPCLTYRKNTERPSTVTIGTNTLVDGVNDITRLIKQIDSGEYKRGNIPEKWDGNAAKRIFNVIYGGENG